MHEIDYQDEPMTQNSINVSPVVAGAKAKKEKEVKVESIVRDYAHIGVDVSQYFLDMSTVSILSCNATGLRFYSPCTLAGDGAFYEKLQSLACYYMQDKWEFRAVLGYLSDAESLLEIGSGRGDFLLLAAKYCSSCIGLELNADAVAHARSCGIEVHNESLESFIGGKEGSFDVVCSFQVMEHVADVSSVLSDSLAALRDGGKLIVSVPNNESFVGLSESCLNGPPHHMNLWDKQSLEKLVDYYPMQIEEILIEKLQPQHYLAFCSAMIKSKLRESFFRKCVIAAIRESRIYKIMRLFRKYTTGHTIIAVYRKQSLPDQLAPEAAEQ